MRDRNSARGMQRAELAKRSACNLETVRYYAGAPANVQRLSGL